MVSNGRTVSYTGHAMETKEVAWKALHKRKVARFHRVAHRYVAIARDVELMVCLNSPPPPPKHFSCCIFKLPAVLVFVLTRDRL